MLTVVEDDIDTMKSTLADLQKAKSTIEEAIEAIGPLKKYKPAYDDYKSGVISKWVIGHIMDKDIKAYEEAKVKVDAAAKYGKTDKKSLKAMLKKIDSEISQTKGQIQLNELFYWHKNHVILIHILNILKKVMYEEENHVRIV